MGLTQFCQGSTRKENKIKSVTQACSLAQRCAPESPLTPELCVTGQTCCGEKASFSSCGSERPQTTLNLIPVRQMEEEEEQHCWQQFREL